MAGRADKELRFKISATENVSDAARKAGRGLDDLGGEMRDVGNEAQTLDRQIDQLEDELKSLVTQIVAAGDAATRADLMRKFRAEQRDINQLKKLRGVLGDVVRDVEHVTEQGGKKSFNLLGGAFATLPPQAQAGVAAAGVAVAASLTTAVAAAVSAGILLGLGGGVLAAGIKAAASNEHVKAAWSAFGDQAKEALAGFDDPFVEPLAKLAFLAGDSLDRMAPALKRMAAAMGPVVDKLGPALLEGLERALPGLEKAVIASIPLFEKLAEHLPALGEAVSKFFEAIAKGGPGALAFFGMLLTVLEAVIIGVGNLISAFSTMFAGSVAGARLMLTAILSAFDLILAGAATAFGWIPGIGGKLQNASAAFQAFKNRVNAELAGIQDETVIVTVQYVISGTQGFGRAGTAGSRSPHSTTVSGVVGFGHAEHGGPVQAGRPYIVGERRPELFVPDRDGTILPRVPTGGGGGADAATLARAIRSALVGVAVVMDGRAVGRMEGKTADLYARGG